MAKIKQDFSLYAGDDKDIIFTITNDAGDPVVLTDTNAVWGFYRMRATPEEMLTKTVDDGGITVLATSPFNTYTVHLTGDDTVELNGKYRHELRMVKSDDVSESVIAIGQLQIYNSLTRNINI